MAKTVKMYTSYYGNYNLRLLQHADSYLLVSISVSVPRDMRYRKDIVHFDEVKPDWSTVDKFKKGIYSEGDYYAEYMRKLFRNEKAIAKKLVSIYRQSAGKTVVFLCYEKPDQFCHRHLFAEFCNKKYNNLNISELYG